MAMTRGSISIADDEGESGSGYARDLFDEIKARETDPAQGGRALPSLSPPPDFTQGIAKWRAEVGPVRVRILRAWARQANAQSLIVDYIQANAQLRVLASTDGGLQLDNTGGNPATLAPSGNVDFGKVL